MSWLSKPLDNSMYLHNPELNSADYVIPTLDLTSPTPAYPLSYTKNLIVGINVSTLLNENNKVILASILGAFIVKLNRYSIASNSKTKSYKAPSGFYMSYLDLVIANAKSAMSNLVIYMNTGSSSVSEAKNPFNTSDKPESSKSKETIDDRINRAQLLDQDREDETYFSRMSSSLRNRIQPILIELTRQNPLVDKAGVEKTMGLYQILFNAKTKARVELKVLEYLTTSSDITLDYNTRVEINIRIVHLEQIMEEVDSRLKQIYKNLSQGQRQDVKENYKNG